MAKLPDNPNTRLERYLARLAGQDVSIPDTPINRIECYLAYLIENGGGAAAPNAGAHNAIYRGKNLGSTFTDAQADAIDSGTFEDIFVGDYWTMGGVNYRVAGLDLFLKSGNTTGGLLKHHAVIVPDTIVGTSYMNSENTTEGGYLNSYMKTTSLPAALDVIKSRFNNNILSHNVKLCNSVSGTPSGWQWVSSEIDLMAEGQVLGRSSWGTQAQNGYNVGLDYAQFPLFMLNPSMIIVRNAYWLRDVRNANAFSLMGTFGDSDTLGASTAHGIRPYFLVGKPA